jgi:hypothetical protein
MAEPSYFFESVLDKALAEVKARAIPVFTFALYHDHESEAVSVCVDTEENSNQFVLATNRLQMRYFMEAVENGDLKHAALWQANIGRSLSLGDFQLVNLARTQLNGIVINDQFYVMMVKALVAVQGRVATLAPEPERLILACSGPDAEVAYVWSLPDNA